jgi:hypothetical protein
MLLFLLNFYLFCSLEESAATTGFDDSYYERVKENVDMATKRGIDAALQEHNLDALVAPMCGSAYGVSGQSFVHTSSQPPLNTNKMFHELYSGYAGYPIVGGLSFLSPISLSDPHVQYLSASYQNQLPSSKGWAYTNQRQVSPSASCSLVRPGQRRSFSRLGMLSST